ncbi:MAG: tripartite tricarboxylate transporter substrate binding protein [Betaproteobacteria bacterium]|nr:tripartite tricarboxylate transporter substrate binding protein [Betaproteobacteria bacterium]MBV9359924.1 tripartite tricarboxylate transporter substrate binding protein [Betaproteobacteria bacterium]
MIRSVFLLCAFLSATAFAQYPTKPVKVYLHFPSGGSTDVVTRILANALGEAMGQPFVVENKLGADGAIAADAVIKSPPDGYTLFVATNTAMMQVPLMKKEPPYDPVTAFTPVSLVGRYTFVLVVSPSLGVKTMKELIAYAKQNPGKINFASYSSASQLAYAQIVKTANVDMVRIPYKGEAPSVTDLLGGTIHAVFATPTVTLSHIREGKLNALAVTTPTRSPVLPEVPTTVEAGMPPIKVEFFAAMFGPAKMPIEIAHRISKELNSIIARPQIRELVDKQGFALAGSTPEELGTFVKQQLAAWKQGFEDAGIKPD